MDLTPINISKPEQFPRFLATGWCQSTKVHNSCNSSVLSYQTFYYLNASQDIFSQTPSSCKMRHILLLLPCLVSGLELDQGGLDQIKSLADVRVGGEAGAHR